MDQDSYMIWLLTLYLEAKTERQQKDAEEEERQARANARR